MKHYWNTLGTAIAGLVTGMLVTWAPVTMAQSQPLASSAPQSYGSWGAKWWQWALSMPATNNPIVVTGAIDCTAGQMGHVYFLAGFFSLVAEPLVGERTCSIPRGRALFFPILNVECSSVEADPFHGGNKAERTACAQALLTGEADLAVTIDGQPFDDLALGRATSRDFKFEMPAEDNLLGLLGVSGGRSVTDGYWFSVPPLSTGEHTIRILGRFGSASPLFGYQTDVIYHLTVEN